MKRFFTTLLLGSAILIFTAGIAHAQGQIWQTIVGDPEPAEILIIDDGSGGGGGGGGGAGGNQTAVRCPSKNYRQCLRNQFNVTVAGSPRESDLAATYRGYQIVSKYKRFYNAFKKGNITITYMTAPSVGPAWARVFENGDMELYRNIWTRSVRYQNYFMIHEGAHVADDRMGRVKDDLYLNAYTEQRDRDCFNSKKIITTYPWSVITPPITLRNQKNESFAESVANAIQCKEGKPCGPNGGSSAGVINNWPNKCKWIHNFILQKIN